MVTVTEIGEHCISKQHDKVFGDGKPKHHKLSHWRDPEP